MIWLETWLPKRKRITVFRADFLGITECTLRGTVRIRAKLREVFKRRSGELGFRDRMLQLNVEGTDGNQFVAQLAGMLEARTIWADSVRATVVSDNAVLIEVLQDDKVRSSFMVAPEVWKRLAAEGGEG